MYDFSAKMYLMLCSINWPNFIVWLSLIHEILRHVIFEWVVIPSKCFKGTLMQIWKSVNIFIFIWIYYVEDFTLKHLLLFEICSREIREKFVCKHLETIEYVKNWLTLQLQSYSHPEVLLGKGVLKIFGKFTEEHPCRSVISIKFQSNFIEITLRHGCSPVNLLHFFRTPFPRNAIGWLLL